MKADNTISLYKVADDQYIGYCSIVGSWGSDETIIASARMSTDKSFVGWGPLCEACKSPLDRGVCNCGCNAPSIPGDEKLLRYLYVNDHATPFEFCGMSIEMQIPIFVLRQVQRHRAAGYNEMSGRYTEMPDIFWSPMPSDVRRQGGSNKQGSIQDSSDEWALQQAKAAVIMQKANTASFEAYKELVSMGVAREQARAVLPLAQMTRCRMTSNLRMWMHFCSLRLHTHAQPETRELAFAIYRFLKKCFPRSMDLFDDKYGYGDAECGLRSSMPRKLNPGGPIVNEISRIASALSENGWSPYVDRKIKLRMREHNLCLRKDTLKYKTGICCSPLECWQKAAADLIGEGVLCRVVKVRVLVESARLQLCLNLGGSVLTRSARWLVLLDLAAGVRTVVLGTASMYMEISYATRYRFLFASR